MNDSAHYHREARPSATEQDASLDELFDLLRDDRRRTVLSVLDGRDSPIDVSTLARAVADSRHDDPSDEAIEDVRVTLHHVHLPKLAAASLVDYDRDARTVDRPGSGFTGVSIDVE